MPDRTEGLDGVLSDAATRRLANQLARAHRGTYGARTGLRMIVRSVARQMIQAGSSPEAVASTFEHYVLNHPSCDVADARTAVADKLNARTLVELTQECVNDVAHETRSFSAPS